MKQFFDIENEAQKKFYLQTIEELKREHHDLLLKQKNEQMTQNELGEEYFKEKQQLEKQIDNLQNQIEQITVKSQLEITEQKNLCEMKFNEYKQLQEKFEEYKLYSNANSNNMTELNERVRNSSKENMHD